MKVVNGRSPARLKILYVVTEDWYFCSHRMPVAMAARDAGFDISVITRVANEEARIRNAGFRIHRLNMHRGGLNPVRDFFTFLKLVQILRKERPAIVHNVALKPVLLGTLAARVTGSVAVVNALAGLGYVFTSEDGRATWLRRFVRLACRILLRGSSVSTIVQNPADQQVIQSLGVPPAQIALIAGSGVDLSVFNPVPEADGPIIVAMVSRMLWSKGVGEFIDAARIVLKKKENIQFLLVGGPDPENPSSVEVEKLQGWVREGIVDWTGSTPSESIPQIWHRAHVGVLPSYYGEGVPKCLLEAGASGRPLIATDTPGCRDVVVDGETGLLVPPHDPRALAGAILQLAENASLRARLGKAARERIEKQFAVNLIVERTLVHYRTILSSAQSL